MVSLELNSLNYCFMRVCARGRSIVDPRVRARVRSCVWSGVRMAARLAVRPGGRAHSSIRACLDRLFYNLFTSKFLLILDKGRRYRRHDEIGTPLCVTIDSLSVAGSEGSGDGCVTVRARDTGVQVSLFAIAPCSIVRGANQIYV